MSRVIRPFLAFKLHVSVLALLVDSSCFLMVLCFARSGQAEKKRRRDRSKTKGKDKRKCHDKKKKKKKDKKGKRRSRGHFGDILFSLPCIANCQSYLLYEFFHLAGARKKEPSSSSDAASCWAFAKTSSENS